MRNVAFVAANLFANGLLFFRCFVLWDRNGRVIVFPASLFASSFALSSVAIYQAAGRSLPSPGIPYWCLSIVFNVLASMMICGRLLWHHHTTLYATLSAMFIESAALYVVVGIIHVTLFVQESNLFHSFEQWYSEVLLLQCISPDVMILRVALGRAGSFKASPPTIGAHLKFPEVSRCSSSLHPEMDISSTAKTFTDLTVQNSNAGSHYCHPV
ncbi:hypothetical protein BU17DRAFT_43639 [Hysterangium stoloniferum]|nr:hypothetical protein BU17DRAFT_43639 [Hysterangium stoloniferum]